MELGLKGKKAIVTGGTRGIGRAIANLLVEEGCDIGICARTAGQLEEAVAAFRAKGVKASGASVDVADGEELTRFIRLDEFMLPTRPEITPCPFLFF